MKPLCRADRTGAKTAADGMLSGFDFNQVRNMMKTLQTIQTLSMIGKVLSKMISIACIVGMAGCAVGVVAVSLGGEVLKFGGMTLHGILEAEGSISIGTVWAAIAVGAILCLGEFFLSRMACRYFENELAAGTPFTVDGAKELLHLGISAIWMPLVTIILAQVARGVIAQCMEKVAPFDLSGYGSVALGVALLVASLLCRYGAECEKGENDRA